MNKKTIILVICLLSVLVWLVLIRQYQPKPNNSVSVSHQMRGIIMEHKNGSIIIKGAVESLTGDEQNKTLEFKITSQTVFKQQVPIVVKTQRKNDQPYPLKSEDRPGTEADLKAKTLILRLLSDDNLFTTTIPTAKEIYYLGDILPITQ